MPPKNLALLAASIREERAHLLTQWQQEVRKLSIAQDLDTLSLNDHVPEILEELAYELENCLDESMIEQLKGNPAAHGLQRLKLGFDVEEIIAEYNALRSVIQDLIERNGLNLSGVNRTVNRVIDGSIGVAVKTFAAQRALELQQRREEHLAFIVHDLRSPLAAIGLASHFLEKNIPEETKNHRITGFLNNLHQNISLLDEVILKLVQEEANLNANAAFALKCRRIDLHTLVNYVIGYLSPLAENSNTTLVNAIRPQLEAFADENFMILIFQNLISNAINYTPNGEVVVSAVSSEGFIECSVKDNGAGIPEERLGKIFEKLETDRRDQGGMGLGLAIVKKFVEAHGGRVYVESKVGLGSTFRFTLPEKKES